jgi:hypothetical protein
MPKPLHIIRDGASIVFYSDAIYKELNMSVKPRKWDPAAPAGPGRARPGAWVYPAEPVVAAALLRTFKEILTAAPDSYVEPEVAALADLPRIRSKTEAWEHQTRAFWRAYNAPGFMLALDMGCISGNEIISITRTKKSLSSSASRYSVPIQKITVGTLYQKFNGIKGKWDLDYPIYTRSISKGKIILNKIIAVLNKGVKPTLKITASSGRSLTCTHDHLLLGTENWKEAKDFIIGESLALTSNVNGWGTHFEEITNISQDIEQNVYDLAMEAPNHNFVANGFIVHNCGKSKIAVDLAVNRSDRKILIVCPKAVIDVWPKQFSIHAAPEFNPLIIKLNTKQTVKEKAEIVRQWSRTARPLVVVCNYDIVYREPLAGELLKAGFDCVIADESHKIKAPGGKASKFMAVLGRRVGHRLALTGTPMPNNPGEIYAQYRFLDPAIFGTRYSDFLANYGGPLDDYGKPRNWRNLAELNAKIYSIAERVKSSDVLDLPPVQHIDYYFELSPRARIVYDDLEEKFRAELINGEITVTNAITKLLRFAQLTGGYAKSDDGVLTHVDNGKREIFQELLEQLSPDEPAVVFCRFREDLESVHKAAAALNRRSLELSGRRNELAGWQNGGAPVLAVQIQSGGAGVDCTRACHVFYYSVGYSNGDYEQSLKRSDRPGQTRPVRFYHLLASNTVDIEIMAALSQKRDIVNSILDHRKHDTEAA